MNGLENLKSKLANGEKTYGSTLLFVNYAGLAAIYKNSGADFLIIDMEHGSFYPEAVGDLCYAMRKEDLPTIARVQDCEYHCISKCLDMGCDGVLIPRTETMEQVETAIRSLRMPPIGKKGVGGRNLLRAGEKIGEFNNNRMLFIQIESVQGVDLLDEMLTKYGDQIEGILVGPSDFGVSMGIGLTMNEEMENHLRRLISICKKHSKSCGIMMGSDADIEKWHGEGMNIFWCGAEITMLSKEIRRTKQFIDKL
ncbi:MAG: aldolase/citrate lyase family protein [Clostridia bacterium]|nr:aldolase/citrate lyase family protein [Clostridia bacterium]